MLLLHIEVGKIFFKNGLGSVFLMFKHKKRKFHTPTHTMLLITLVLVGLAMASARDFLKVFKQGLNNDQINGHYLRNSSHLFDVQDYLPLDGIAVDARWIHLKDGMVGGKGAVTADGVSTPTGIKCEVYRGSSNLKIYIYYYICLINIQYNNIITIYIIIYILYNRFQ